MTGVPASALPDLLRALTLLGPEDDAARAEVARLLGIEIALPAMQEPAAPAAETKRDPPRQPLPPPSAARPGTPPKSQSAASTAPTPISSADREISAVLVPDYSERRRPPRWLEDVEPFAEAEGSASVPAPRPEPLLVPHWTRGILGAAVATLSEAGPLDVERLVRGVARGLPWRQVPREPWPTLAHGVQVLIDRGDAMLPFAADQEQLVEQAGAVAGRDRLQALDFAGCPSWGAGAGSQGEWEDYFERWRPPAGTPVLALTDLGIGAGGYGSRPARPAEWSAFAERLRRAGCPLVALVPYARERWPAGLDRSLRILPWDRGTSARTVRRVVGRALRTWGWEPL